MTRRRRRKSRAHCPCGSGLLYAKCCAPFHRGRATPESPQALMRSRYSAYAKQLVDYIVDTTDPNGDAWQDPVDQWRREIRQFSENTDFMGVKIIASDVDDHRATVTFLARLQRSGEDTSFTEESQFTCRDGRWLYSTGKPR